MIGNFIKTLTLILIYKDRRSRLLWNARNNAIKSTSEKIITLLDDDSRVNHDWLLNHMKCLHYYDSRIFLLEYPYPKLEQKIPSNYYFYRGSDQIVHRKCHTCEIFLKCGFSGDQFDQNLYKNNN